MQLEKKELLYSGKAKSLFTTSDSDLLIAEFRNDTSAFDGVKVEQLDRKGYVNNQISAFIMERLEEAGIPTHFECLLSPTETVVRKLTMIPLENVVRNIAAGSLCRRLGVSPNMELTPPLHELFLKNDELHDPMVNDNHALSFGWATQEQLDQMRSLSLQINEVLAALFQAAGMMFVDGKYEFGVDAKGVVRLGDEISPDSCRIWDASSKESLDKDRFRKDMGGVVEHYELIAKQLGVSLD